MDESDGNTQLTAWYRRYNARCNNHQFDTLGEFVASDVQVNGKTQGLGEYINGLTAVAQAFPDYRWNLRHLLVDGSWLSAHFINTGTHRGSFLGVAETGRAVNLQEFSIYRLEAGKIVEVWVLADNLHLLQLLQ